MDANGCGTCHGIPGNDTEQGRVGPPLNHMAQRSIVARKPDARKDQRPRAASPIGATR